MSTVFVVMATANHYFFDAVAGAAVMLAATLIVTRGEHVATWVSGRFQRSPAPEPALAESVPGDPV